LEILRILNTKGPLSYSELKALAGFKSKKESGKFAYHLRKLVRQRLIALNRGERKYTVTNLGRLILNLTRQIEEHTLLESGKLYVRTSRQTLEEFNPNRILQSLVREAGMPLELAQKITNETEARLHKFQANYLTAPLIREFVNALLIEYGLEEYRHRLTRLGLPVYDVTEMLNEVGKNGDSVESLLAKTAGVVFFEYLLLAQLPRDVADDHLSGDIHLAKAGTWILMPDTVFIDLMALRTHGFNRNGGIGILPRIDPPTNLREMVAAVATLTTVAAKETSVEVVLNNLGALTAHFTQNGWKDAEQALLRLMLLLSSVTPHPNNGPAIAVEVGEPVEGVEALLNAYSKYLGLVSDPRIRLIVSRTVARQDGILQALASLVDSGGRVVLSQERGVNHSSTGLRRSAELAGETVDNVAFLHTLSLNLPRLAYESNRDEVYFRAKLALLLKTAVEALIKRKKILEDMIRRGVLLSSANVPPIVDPTAMPLVVNLTGLEGAVDIILPGEEGTAKERRRIVGKVVETAVKVAREKGEEDGERVGISILDDEAGERFQRLDLDKYGRGVVEPYLEGYTALPTLFPQDLNPTTVVGILAPYYQANGGVSITLDLEGHNDPTEAILKKLTDDIPFLRLRRRVLVCRNCGAKRVDAEERCPNCMSSGAVVYHTA
jgi:ribonucleoside-triphosphate reductase